MSGDTFQTRILDDLLPCAVRVLNLPRAGMPAVGEVADQPFVTVQPLPAFQVRQDSPAEPDLRRSLLLALRDAGPSAAHGAGLKVDLIPLEGQDDTRPGAGIELEQDQPSQVLVAARGP